MKFFAAGFVWARADKAASACDQDTHLPPPGPLPSGVGGNRLYFSEA